MNLRNRVQELYLTTLLKGWSDMKLCICPFCSVVHSWSVAPTHRERESVSRRWIHVSLLISCRSSLMVFIQSCKFLAFFLSAWADASNARRHCTFNVVFHLDRSEGKAKLLTNQTGGIEKDLLGLCSGFWRDKKREMKSVKKYHDERETSTLWQWI